MWKEYLAATLVSLTCTSLIFIFIYLWIPSLPRRQRVFIEQCWRRFKTMFTGVTNLNYKACKEPVPFFSSWFRPPCEKVVRTIPIPNIFIVLSYVACCLGAIILLP